MKVIHRGDQMLQRSVAGELKNISKESVISIRRAALEFLEGNLIGEEIENKPKLQKILDKWPDYAKGKIISDDCEISPMREQDGLIICNDGEYNLLVVAIVKF